MQRQNLEDYGHYDTSKSVEIQYSPSCRQGWQKEPKKLSAKPYNKAFLSHSTTHKTTTYVERITCPTRRLFYEQNDVNNAILAKKLNPQTKRNQRRMSPKYLQPPNLEHGNRFAKTLQKKSLEIARIPQKYFQPSNVEHGDRYFRPPQKSARELCQNPSVEAPHLKYGLFGKRRAPKTIRPLTPKIVPPKAEPRSKQLSLTSKLDRKQYLPPRCHVENQRQRSNNEYCVFYAKPPRNLSNLCRSEIMHMDIRPQDLTKSPNRFMSTYLRKPPQNQSSISRRSISRRDAVDRPTSPHVNSYREIARPKSPSAHNMPTINRETSPIFKLGSNRYVISSNRSMSYINSHSVSGKL